MITNWHSTHIDPGHLSRRLKVAYAMWLWQSVNCEDNLPTLDQMQSRRLYDEISPYLAIVEGRAGSGIDSFFYASAGTKVEDLYGVSLNARRMEEIHTEAGRRLAEESFALLRKERRPVHLGIRGSPVLSSEIQMIVLPLRHINGDMELAGLVYDF
jgi:hypothetical protein